MTPLMPIPPLAPSINPPAPSDTEKLRALAVQLEAGFLAEMLGHAGLGNASEAFGGGIGEDQFSSFLRKSQAEAIAGSGGIGLAESLFRSMIAGPANDR